MVRPIEDEIRSILWDKSVEASKKKWVADRLASGVFKPAVKDPCPQSPTSSHFMDVVGVQQVETCRYCGLVRVSGPIKERNDWIRSDTDDQEEG